MKDLVLALLTQIQSHVDKAVGNHLWSVGCSYDLVLAWVREEVLGPEII